MLDSDTARELIRPHMLVVGSDGRSLPPVDHIEGISAIALERDMTGVAHYIPLTWVQSVDDRVHLDHTAAEVTREWTTAPPKGA